jgi:hypothetical protein
MSAPIVVTPEEITPEWLSAALGKRVDAISASPVGTGQMGTCYRIAITGDPSLPATVLAKLPSTEEATRELMANAYGNEVRFYRDLADTVDVNSPHCYFAALGDGGAFTLLLEDLAPSEQGDQIAGCDPEQAHDAAVNLAGLHGPRWCDPALMEIEGMLPSGPEMGEMLDLTFPPAVDTFVEMFADRLTPEDLQTLRDLAPVAGKWIAGRAERFSLLHMDYRLDNLMFPPDGPGVSAVDWQGMSIGLPARDVAFFLSTGLKVEDRRTHEESIVRDYHERLVQYAGLADYSWEQCWDDYRFGMLQTPFITIFGAVYSVRSDRGDDMFMAMNERGCAAIRDLRTLDLLR